ncbi:hypothetical protein PLIIFM63780_007539 [Purpureocillium lilacinum]|nr:hypothetical protein PLIIFM63780_007539 [Purpureocillium lilacinum]
MSLPDPRRIVTGHDEAGNAIFVADSAIPMAPTPVECDFAVLYETHQFPASNDTWEDPMLTRTKSLANEKGIVLRCVDFRPNTKTRGTIHGWDNRTDETARVYFVLSGKCFEQIT